MASTRTGASPVHHGVPVEGHKEHLTAATRADRGKEHLQRERKHYGEQRFIEEFNCKASGITKMEGPELKNIPYFRLVEFFFLCFHLHNKHHSGHLALESHLSSSPVSVKPNRW